MRPGVYRRRIQSLNQDRRIAVILEDDPHCYRITMHIDDNKVETISCESIRTPWSLCSGGAQSLQKLVGMSVNYDMNALLAQVDRSQHCTHMLDAAVLGISHFARGIRQRQYDISVDYLLDKPVQDVVLARDGETLLQIAIEDGVVVCPAEFAGTSVKILNQVMIDTDDDQDKREAVSLLRRAIYISANRQADLDTKKLAIDVSPGLGACYVYHKDRAHLAKRNIGATREFTHSTEKMVKLVNVE